MNHFKILWWTSIKYKYFVSRDEEIFLENELFYNILVDKEEMLLMKKYFPQTAAK